MRNLFLILAVFLTFTAATGRPRTKAHERKSPGSQHLEVEDLYAKLEAMEKAQKRKNTFMMKRVDAAKDRAIRLKKEQKQASDLILDLDDDVAYDMESLRNRTEGLEAREHRYVDEFRLVALELKRIDDEISSLNVSRSDFKKLSSGWNDVIPGHHVNESEPSEFDALKITLKKLSAQIKWIHKELKDNHIV